MTGARIDLAADGDLSPRQRDRRAALSALVYPKEVLEEPAFAAVQWAPTTVSALVWTDGDVATHVGGIARNVLLDGREIRIGGIGSVMTAPAARGRGHVRAAIERMHGHLVAAGRVDFLLLFCADRLVPFYGKLGWRRFAAPPMVTQHGARIRFTYNNPMVRDGVAAAPTTGSLDLLGPPW